MLKILVTGASGFIGKPLVKKLVDCRCEVLAFDKRRDDLDVKFIQGDLRFFDFDEILDDVDIVFHLAGLLGTTELFHRVIEAEEVNVLGTLNLLESMRRKQVKRLIFSSKPNIWKYNVYTITKENCERYLEMYQKVYGFEVTIARLFNVYGPGEYLREYRKAIPYFIVSALRDEPIEVFGDGEQTLDPIYISDAVEALVKCAEKKPRKIVEIGSSKPIKVKELAEKIIELTKSKSKIVYKPMRRGELGPKIVCANNDLEKELGFKPKVRLEEGLKATIEWYKKHLDEFREIYQIKDEDLMER